MVYSKRIRCKKLAEIDLSIMANDTSNSVKDRITLSKAAL